MTRAQTARKKRANGVEWRQRILDAAVEIAGERGYQGASIAAYVVRARSGAYSASKAAVEHLTKFQAVELGPCEPQGQARASQRGHMPGPAAGTRRGQGRRHHRGGLRHRPGAGRRTRVRGGQTGPVREPRGTSDPLPGRPVCEYRNGCIARFGGKPIDCYVEPIRIQKNHMLRRTEQA